MYAGTGSKRRSWQGGISGRRRDFTALSWEEFKMVFLWHTLPQGYLWDTLTHIEGNHQGGHSYIDWSAELCQAQAEIGAVAVRYCPQDLPTPLFNPYPSPTLVTTLVKHHSSSPLVLVTIAFDSTFHVGYDPCRAPILQPDTSPRPFPKPTPRLASPLASLSHYSPLTLAQPLALTSHQPYIEHGPCQTSILDSDKDVSISPSIRPLSSHRSTVMGTTLLLRRHQTVEALNPFPSSATRINIRRTLPSRINLTHQLIDPLTSHHVPETLSTSFIDPRSRN
jgi:hypothetical protein